LVEYPDLAELESETSRLSSQLAEARGKADTYGQTLDRWHDRCEPLFDRLQKAEAFTEGGVVEDACAYIDSLRHQLDAATEELERLAALFDGKIMTDDEWRNLSPESRARINVWETERARLEADELAWRQARRRITGLVERPSEELDLLAIDEIVMAHFVPAARLASVVNARLARIEQSTNAGSMAFDAGVVGVCSEILALIAAQEDK
jgi:hypothetical protein